MNATMNNLSAYLLILLFFIISQQDLKSQGVSINSDGSDPHPSAMLEIKSNGKGLLIPRMTKSERPSVPVAGLMIFQTDDNPGYYIFNGVDWQKTGTVEENFWQQNSSGIHYTDGKIGIGTTSPDKRLHLYDEGNNADISMEDTYPFIFMNSLSPVGNMGIKFNRLGSAAGWIIKRGNDGALVLTARNYENPSNDLTLGEDGKIGIGLVSSGSRLHIHGIGTDPALRVDAGGNPRLQVNSNGSIAIGGDFDGPVNGLYVSGNLHIGSSAGATGYQLAVDGKIICEEIRVESSDNWPDFVFDKSYKLLSATELEAFIEKEKHLPGIPSAKTIEKDGIALGQMQKLMMQKIEELTLYYIQQSKDLEMLKRENEQLKMLLLKK